MRAFGLLVLRSRLQPLVDAPGCLGDVFGGHLLGFGERFCEPVLLLVDAVDLPQMAPHLLLKLLAVALGRLLPGERVLVGGSFGLGAVEEEGLERDEALVGRKLHGLREDRLEDGADPLAPESVHRRVVERGHAAKPHEMDALARGALDLARRADACRVGVDDDLEHHLRVVGARAASGVERAEPGGVDGFDDGVRDSHQVALGDRIGQVGGKQHHLALVAGLENGLRHGTPCST